jgi:hypothetical protein
MPAREQQRVPRRTLARLHPLIGMEERGPVTSNRRQVSGCGHDGRLRQPLEAFLINFITQLGHAGEAGHPQEPPGSPSTCPQGLSARALSFAMVCPATMRSADAQRHLDQLCQVDARIALAYGLIQAFPLWSGDAGATTYMCDGSRRPTTGSPSSHASRGGYKLPWRRSQPGSHWARATG